VGDGAARTSSSETCVGFLGCGGSQSNVNSIVAFSVVGKGAQLLPAGVLQKSYESGTERLERWRLALVDVGTGQPYAKLAGGHCGMEGI
jgi:hypothetical protein